MVLHHFLESTNLGNRFLVIEILKQGQAAVILFFLLSGFVIHYNYRGKVKVSYKNYYIKRARRIYPIYLLALFFPYLLWLVSQSPTPINPTLTNFLGGIFMLQDLGRYPGVAIKTFYNSPLWSISYEWFFYLIYLPLLKLKPQNSIIKKGFFLSVIAFILFIFFNDKLFMTLSYFIIWAIGADIAESFMDYSKYTFRKYMTHLTILILFTVGFLTQANFEETLKFGLYPFIQSYHFTASLIIITSVFLLQRIKFLGRIKDYKLIKFFSNISYALYAIHYPICISIYQIFFKTEEVSILAFLIGFVITIILSYLLEVKFQMVINRKTNRFLNV